jgi:hypothetical protein
METLSITFSLEEIKGMLYQKLNPNMGVEERKLITEVLIGNLSKTPVGISQMYKSFLGIAPELKYSADTDVYVRYSNLYTWRFDEDIMKERIHKGGISVKILDTDLYREDPYCIHYFFINKDGKDDTAQHWVREQDILGIVDGYPLNM